MKGRAELQSVEVDMTVATVQAVDVIEFSHPRYRTVKAAVQCGTESCTVSKRSPVRAVFLTYRAVVRYPRRAGPTAWR